MNPKSRFIIIGIVGVAIVGAITGFLLLQRTGKPGSEPVIQGPVQSPQTLEIQETLSLDDAKETLGGQIIGKAQNPIEGELPATNPFEETTTNPLKNIYKNPFD